MIFNSIRWRIQAWNGLLMMVVIVAFGITIHRFEHVQRLRRADNELQQRSTLITIAVPPDDVSGGRRGDPRFPPFDRPSDPSYGPPPVGREEPARQPRLPDNRRREFRPPDEIVGLLRDSIDQGYYYAVWGAQGNEQARSENSPIGLSIPSAVDRAEWQWMRSRENQRELIRVTASGRTVLIGKSFEVELIELRRLALWLCLVGGAVLVLGLVGGWLLGGQAIRPISDISVAASRISNGDLSQRIDTSETRSELGKLARVLNTTFARLEGAFARQKQFTADASHELRTPLAVIISEAQTSLSRERSAGEYRETVEACLASAQDMRRLTDSLLDIARIDADADTGDRVAYDLGELAQSCTDALAAMAAKNGVTVCSEVWPVEAFGNPDRVVRVATNLIANAIHYNRENGEVHVSVHREDDRAVMEVKDTGIGISQEDLPLVFGRFFRVDGSRSRKEGHSGLGLAICKSIVESEGGTIEVSSELHKGSVFTVKLPVS